MLDVILRLFRTFNRVERFQHWLYCEPKTPSIDTLDQIYLSFCADPLTDWTGLEAFQQRGWQHFLVITRPFYSIEYIVSWIATLLFLNKYRQDTKGAMQALSNVLHFGKTRGLAESFAELGITFPFRHEELSQAREIFEKEFLSPSLD